MTIRTHRFVKRLVDIRSTWSACRSVQTRFVQRRWLFMSIRFNYWSIIVQNSLPNGRWLTILFLTTVCCTTGEFKLLVTVISYRSSSQIEMSLYSLICRRNIFNHSRLAIKYIIVSIVIQLKLSFSNSISDLFFSFCLLELFSFIARVILCM